MRCRFSLLSAVVFVLGLTRSKCFSRTCNTSPTDSWSDVDQLVKQLLSFCREYSGTRSQDEINFRGSTHTLYRLGKIYWKRANGTTERSRATEQKRDYIRSAALLYGTKVRYDVYLKAYLGKFLVDSPWAFQMEDGSLKESQDCVVILGNAYVGEGTTLDIFASRNNISLCITLFRKLEHLSNLKRNFMELLLEEEMTRPDTSSNVRRALSKLNLTLTGLSTDVMVDMHAMAGNSTCLEKDIDSMLGDFMKSLGNDLGNLTSLESLVQIFRNASTDFAEALTILRNTKKTKLSGINANNSKEKRISEINEILKDNSRNYVQLLKNISDRSFNILPHRLPKFTVINFGSISRKESTLYSDIEHGIIFESPATKDDKNIRYFLWYTTLLHIVVISLEETMIHTVNITELGKYYDSFTPRGFAFDGMFEPFGRNPFGNGDVLLILNAMNNNLDFNAYRSVLMRTSYGFGNEDIYERFKALRSNFVKSNSKILKTLKYETEKMLSSSRGVISGHNLLHLAKPYEDVKNSLYRPISVILEYMSRIYGFYDGSTTEFLNEMKERYAVSLFDRRAFEDFQYDLARSSELRMNIYEKYGRQMYEVSKEETFDFMSKEEYVLGFMTTVVLRNWIVDLNESCSHEDEASFPNPIFSLRRSKMEFLAEFLEQAKKVANTSKTISDNVKKIQTFFDEKANDEEPIWHAVGSQNFAKCWSQAIDATAKSFVPILDSVGLGWGDEYESGVRSRLLSNPVQCSFSASPGSPQPGLTAWAISGIMVVLSAERLL